MSICTRSIGWSLILPECCCHTGGILCTPQFLFKLSSYSSSLLPVTSVSKWRNHKATSVSKIFISVHNFSCYHSNNHIVVLPVISQLPNPLEVVTVQKIVLCQVSDYITTLVNKIVLIEICQRHRCLTMYAYNWGGKLYHERREQLKPPEWFSPFSTAFHEPIGQRHQFGPNISCNTL